MNYRILGLPPQHFAPLFALDHDALKQRGIDRCIADSKPGFPCRVSLADADVGEELLLFSYAHLPDASPYRASGPVFVRRKAMDAGQAVSLCDQVPPTLASRLLSVRAYDADARMVDAEVCEGAALDVMIRRFLDQPEIAGLHIHFARRGCFAARVERA